MTYRGNVKAILESNFAGFKDEIIELATIGIISLEQPDTKKGKWVKISPADIYECSVCHRDVMTSDIEFYRYCHGCGAKMEVK